MDCKQSTVGETHTANFSGRFTFSDNVVFRELLGVFSKPEVKTLVIEMSGVEFIDSAGLGMLLVAKDEADKRGKALVIKGPQGHVKKLFEASRFYNILRIE